MMLIAGKRGRGGSRFALVSLILLLSVLAISVQAQGVQNLSVDELRSLAGQGDAAAQFELGHRHADGRDVVRDDAEALRWFRLSAEQGHAGAQHNLAFRYAFGQGVPLDDAEAVRWYRLAAEQGHADAQFNLASRYARGRGVPRDDAEAVRWYRLAAEQGDVRAQLELGFRYANGQGVAHDCAAAASLLRPLASKGYAGVVLLMDRMLLPVGGTSGATGLSPQVRPTFWKPRRSLLWSAKTIQPSCPTCVRSRPWAMPSA